QPRGSRDAVATGNNPFPTSHTRPQSWERGWREDDAPASGLSREGRPGLTNCEARTSAWLDREAANAAAVVATANICDTDPTGRTIAVDPTPAARSVPADQVVNRGPRAVAVLGAIAVKRWTISPLRQTVMVRALVALPA